MQRFRIEKYLQHNIRGFWSLDRSRSDEKSQRFPQAPGGSDAGLYCPWYSDATLRGSAADYCRAELLWSMPKLHEKHRQAQIAQKSQLARSWLLQNSQVFVSTEHCLFICCCDSMPTSPEVQNYKTPLPARDATCSNSAATRAFWPVQMVACSLQEPRNSRTQPSCKQVVFWSPTKYFSKVCTVCPALHSNSAQQNKQGQSSRSGCLFWTGDLLPMTWIVYIYIYTYYEIYYVDLLNLMLTVLLLNQGCSLGSFASIPWKRKTNLNYLQMVKKEGWPHLTRPDQMKRGERPNSFVAHVYHVLLGLPAVFV